MPAELMRDANTLAATSMQLGAGLAVAAATVALRVGSAVTGGGQAAYTLAFCLLALIAAGCAAEALRLDPRAGDAARGIRQQQRRPAGAVRQRRPGQRVRSLTRLRSRRSAFAPVSFPCQSPHSRFPVFGRAGAGMSALPPCGGLAAGWGSHG